MRISGKQASHLLGRFKISLIVGKQAVAGIVNRATVANAGKNILKRPPGGVVIVNVVGRQQGDAEGFGERGEVLEIGRVIAAIKRGSRQ